MVYRPDWSHVCISPKINVPGLCYLYTHKCTYSFTAFKRIVNVCKWIFFSPRGSIHQSVSVPLLNARGEMLFCGVILIKRNLSISITVVAVPPSLNSPRNSPRVWPPVFQGLEGLLAVLNKFLKNDQICPKVSRKFSSLFQHNLSSHSP